LTHPLIEKTSRWVGGSCIQGCCQPDKLAKYGVFVDDYPQWKVFKGEKSTGNNIIWFFFISFPSNIGWGPFSIFYWASSGAQVRGCLDLRKITYAINV
jgi:hypothetical protein